MADIGTRYTDKELKKLEKRIKDIYSEAEKDIEKKLKDFMDRYKVKEAIHLQELKDGKITQEDFDAWKRGQVFQGEQWKAKKEQVSNTLYNANTTATKIINGEVTNVFVENANYMSYTLEHSAGVNFGFGMYDNATVANLVKDEPTLLPKKVKKTKDKAWNMKKITSQVTQGIIQGESLDKVAKRIAQVTGSQNMNSMLTHARTSMTGAQNAGRQRSLHEAEEKGIEVLKEWMATLDERTRTTHQELDGQQVPVNEPFKVGGYTIMYPADPQAHPSMVYNCRCTMVGAVSKYPAEYKRYDNIDGKPIKNMTYKEWEKVKSGTKSEAFNISNRIRSSVTPLTASDDWFEYENANAMSEYIKTGIMPKTDINGNIITEEAREQLAAEAEIIQNIGSTTKTNYKTLYRGMVLDEDEARAISPGENYTFDTLSATTTDKNIANIYTNIENSGIENGVSVILEIQKPDGIFGFDRDGIEVILPKGSEFKITRNWMDEDGYVHISLYAKKDKSTRK